MQREHSRGTHPDQQQPSRNDPISGRSQGKSSKSAAQRRNRRRRQRSRRNKAEHRSNLPQHDHGQSAPPHRPVLSRPPCKPLQKPSTPTVFEESGKELFGEPDELKRHRDPGFFASNIVVGDCRAQQLAPPNLHLPSPSNSLPRESPQDSLQEQDFEQQLAKALKESAVLKQQTPSIDWSFRNAEGNCVPIIRTSPLAKDLRDHCVICDCSFSKMACSCCYLDCLHWFHAKCILQWLQKRGVCPICQIPVETIYKPRKP